jgi:hypothetical protein
MHVGHFATGLIGKRIDPKLSLGTMILAADVGRTCLWCVFMLAGCRTDSNHDRDAERQITSNQSTSHTVTVWRCSFVWGAVFAGVHFLWRRSKRSAVLLFSLVCCTGPLDVIAHKSDMPLAPGLPQQFGFGLWTNLIATIIVEGGLWLLSIAIYLRVTRSRSKLALFIFWPVVLLFTAFMAQQYCGTTSTGSSHRAAV